MNAKQVYSNCVYGCYVYGNFGKWIESERGWLGESNAANENRTFPMVWTVLLLCAKQTRRNKSYACCNVRWYINRNGNQPFDAVHFVWISAQSPHWHWQDTKSKSNKFAYIGIDIICRKRDWIEKKGLQRCRVFLLLLFARLFRFMSESFQMTRP